MRRLLYILEWIQAAVGFLNFTALTVVVSLQVLSRFIFEKPLLWSEELARFLLFWLVMNGAALAVLKNRHFTTELFNIDHITNRTVKMTLEIVPNICALAVGLIMMIYGFVYTQLGSYRVVPISQINMMYVYLAIPVSGVLITLYSICQMIFMLTTSLRK